MKSEIKTNSLFITLEGIERAGKTTQIELIGKFLRENNYQVHLFREPGGTDFGAMQHVLATDAEGNVTNAIRYGSWFNSILNLRRCLGYQRL